MSNCYLESWVNIALVAFRWSVLVLNSSASGSFHMVTWHRNVKSERNGRFYLFVFITKSQKIAFAADCNAADVWTTTISLFLLFFLLGLRFLRYPSDLNTPLLTLRPKFTRWRENSDSSKVSPLSHDFVSLENCWHMPPPVGLNCNSWLFQKYSSHDTVKMSLKWRPRVVKSQNNYKKFMRWMKSKDNTWKSGVTFRLAIPRWFQNKALKMSFVSFIKN